MNKFNFFIVFLLITTFSYSTTYAQEVVVKGIVKDATSNELLPGVSIWIEGTTTGTTTNFEGQFTIMVNGPEDQLHFSFIGMEDKLVTVGNQTNIEVVLNSDSEQLDEVLVVAYGTSDKKAFTGAAETIAGESLATRPVSSAASALQGATSGVQVTSSSGQPGSGPTVRIRGVGSMSASSSPLYVIDGVPYDGIGTLNPNDIESMTVLKDAVSASLYGSRAANGVIIVTTKGGKQKEHSRLTVDAQVGVTSLMNNGVKLMNSADYYQQTWNGLFNNQFYLHGKTQNESAAYAHENVEAISGWNPYNMDQPFDYNGNVAAGAKIIQDTDWRNALYQTGRVENYNIGFSHSTEKTNYFLSLGYFDQLGHVKGTDFNRISGRINLDHQINSWLKVGTNNTLSFYNQNAQPNGTAGANPVRAVEIINPTTPIYTEDGDYNWYNTAVLDFNPIGLIEKDIYNTKGNNISSSLYLLFDFNKHLNFKTTGSMNYNSSNSVVYYNPEHGNGSGVNGRGSKSHDQSMALNWSNVLTWDNTYGKHHITLMGGQETYYVKADGLYAESTDFGIGGNPHLGIGAKPEQATSYTSNRSLLSFFSQFSYDFASKYYLNASVRSDGSSRFGENNKFGVFPSLGASWRVGQENFLSNASWINELKLRGSYGLTGNDKIGDGNYLALYSLGSNYGDRPGMTPVQLANPNLQWEKMTLANIGVDFSIFNRIQLSGEYFIKDSDGLLYAQPISYSKGFGSVLTNIGHMVNKGVEITLHTENIVKKNFSWTTDFNLTNIESEIKNIGADQLISGNYLLKEGLSWYSFYLREWAGVNPDTGEPMWFVNVNNTHDEQAEMPETAFDDPHGSGRKVTSEYEDAYRTVNGSALPTLYGGLSNTFKYKNFDFSFLLYYSLGGKIYNYDYAKNMHDGANPGYNLADEAKNSWTPDNKYTDIPRYIVNNEDNGHLASTRFLEKGNYLRLKNVNLGYNLPQSACQKIHISSLRVYFSGENLWTLSNYKGFDPEQALSGSTNDNIPGVATYSVGFNFGL
ncbi:TonB-dependent receptor [Flammeovirga sp. MY04]|uniref:SusC/RagA family TonB-linked outer membrane protein n=1 Tax=Flammeovirga sp. MY04 TaxID=1191459 RepID=UPI00082551B8|nr:TonB-dependent receptor [Flammeovirga sp. MY04]ANQ52831.2 TonB-dependent receptor [Flammeovirga sp. MY04]